MAPVRTSAVRRQGASHAVAVRVQGVGFGVWVWDLGFGVCGLGYRIFVLSRM